MTRINNFPPSSALHAPAEAPDLLRHPRRSLLGRCWDGQDWAQAEADREGESLRCPGESVRGRRGQSRLQQVGIFFTFIYILCMIKIMLLRDKYR